MSREIKFRMWDFESKYMVYPRFEHNEKYVLQLNCEYIGEFDGEKYHSIKLPIMQYTGFKDVKHREVYEGDIVAIIEAKRNYTIEFIDYGFKLVHVDPKLNRMVWGQMNRLSELNFNVEVIGNIHQNPELLSRAAGV